MGMRHIVWTAVRAISPDLHLTLKSMLGARRSREMERRGGQLADTAEFIKRYGPAVLAGPFKGLRFPPAAFGHHLAPKLMGVYEYHLLPCVEAAIERRPGQVVNIGAAEGFYAVGFALRLPESQGYAFDAAPSERRMTKLVAEENGLGRRLQVGGICTVNWLRDHLRPGDLVFSDCEGGEEGLIDPVAAPALRACDLIVECHPHVVPGITERLIERFGATHEIERLKVAEAPKDVLPKVDSWTDADYRRAVSDGRWAEQDWLVLIARDRAGSNS